MFAIFEKEKVISICMLSFLFLSIFTKLFLGSLYQRMIKEADNMSTTENKMLKQCKLKFANCFQLNNGVANIPVFVDKFLNRLSIGPFSFETMYHASGQMMLLSVVASGVGICKSIIDGSMLGEILPFYIVSFLGLYLYFSISTVVDIKGRKRILKVNLIDYLENHLSARIDITESDMEMLFGKDTNNSKSGRLGKTGAKKAEVRRAESRSLEGKRLEGRRGERRKTVELMPIGERISLSEDTQNKTQESILVEGLRREVRKAAGTGMTADSEEIFTKDQEKELEELLKEFLTS